NNSPDESFVQRLSECLNIDRVISHLAFNMVFSNFDSYTGSGRNFYFYDDRDTDQFTMIPWDMNEAFGVFTNNWDVITADVVQLSNADDRPLIRRIMENDSLRLVYFNRMREMIEGPASYDSIVAMTEIYRPFIEEHVLADENKLYSDEMFFDNIENDVRVTLGQVIPGIKSFSSARNENILSQLNGVEVFPGDCDNNGVVDALDILPIGVYFHFEGFVREDASFNWESSRTTVWNVRAATYADANGDGVVDERDVIGIGVNWGNAHTVSTISYAIDPTQGEMLDQYRGNFQSLYNSLSGSSEAITAVKTILETILGIDKPALLSWSLDQNYPNPFNPTTIIRFSLPENQLVTLTVFDLSGRVVMRPILKTTYQSGQHEYLLDGSSLSNGIYFYCVSTTTWNQSRKMVIVK
ncbi:MAG: CotH kinase family protein, partial [Candidatus Electryoneaceae bacterium]|nr:CotH kinase family protein [Candidatus Electryoneaceae bacterium]